MQKGERLGTRKVVYMKGAKEKESMRIVTGGGGWYVGGERMRLRERKDCEQEVQRGLGFKE